MSSPTWNPVDLSSFIFDRDRHRRSASEQTHIVTTHEYHSYRRTESPCEHRNYCEFCPCINCRRFRQPSYRHHMSRRQTSGISPGGRKEFYSSAHSVRDDIRQGSPIGTGISLHRVRPHSPQSPQSPQSRQSPQFFFPQSRYQQQQQQRQPYQPHHFHDTNEYERQRQPRLLQINRRSTREVQPGDQTVPSATNTSRQDEAVIKRR